MSVDEGAVSRQRLRDDSIVVKHQFGSLYVVSEELPAILDFRQVCIPSCD
jgi:hypothetical protein